MNGSLTGILVKLKIKIKEWSSQSDIGFDHSAFRKCQHEEKERDLRNERMKHIDLVRNNGKSSNKCKINNKVF